MSFGGHYILIGKQTRQVPFEVWSVWFRSCKRRVSITPLRVGTVSTTFLGIDHQFGEWLPPLLFETMVFGGRFDGWQCRYSTYDQALKGHRRIVKGLSFINRLNNK